MQRRIFGIETEFGVTCTHGGQRRLTPDEVSRYLFRRVVAWGRSSNVFLGNGSRLYLDVGSHPEYATAECDSIHEAVIHDKAGERILEGLAEEAQQRLDEEGIAGDIYVFKNNTDSAGNSYGCHENYLVGRAGEFGRISDVLIPFLISRQLICGAGKLTAGTKRTTFCLSQRADHIWEGVSSATTRSRPIINTRDEPHAAADVYRRLHVIVGDANQCDVANLLKVGTTSLVLALIEDRAAPGELSVVNPVGALHAVSHDPTLRALITLRDGRRLTALDLLWIYHDACAAYLQEREGDPAGADDDTREVMSRWADVLTRLGSDPMSCARELDWVAKLRVLQAYRDRDGLAWTEPRLAALDIQWSDIRPAKSVFGKVQAAGQIVRLVSDEQVRAAVTTPPEDTRAWFRGECLRRYAAQVVSASWDSVVVEVPGQTSLQRIPMPEPLRGTRAQVAAVLDRSPDIATLLRELARSDD